MIDIHRLRSNPDQIKKQLQHRIASRIIDDVLGLDEQWRKEKSKLDTLLAEKNSLSKKAQTDKSVRAEVKTLKQDIEKAQEKEKKLEQNLLTSMRAIPNIPEDEAPRGSSEKDNVVIREVGTKTAFAFKPKVYLHLHHADTHIGLHEGSNVSGARFAYIKGMAAKIEFALLSFAVNTLSKKGFELIFPPTLIRKEAMEGMGYLDQAGESEIFHIEKDDLFLIGTAEQAIGPMFMGETLSHKDLPRKFIAFTPSYRREAGSYGKDTKGILRLHQFEKIEMFAFTTSDQSQKTHQNMLILQEELMQKLKLPYRVVDLATGDLGLPSSRTFDIETFLPGQNSGKGEYRETHSTSNCTDFQARRLNIKYKNEKGEKSFVHTVNGTAFAMQRMIIAIMENYQKEDGTFDIPDALQQFLPENSSS